MPRIHVKKTSPLSVISDYSFDEATINIHPNDGFDLGLMTTSYDVAIFPRSTSDDASRTDSGGVPGTVNLKNECRVGTVEVSLKTVKSMGSPRKITLSYDDGKLLLTPV